MTLAARRPWFSRGRRAFHFPATEFANYIVALGKGRRDLNCLCSADVRYGSISDVARWPSTVR